MPPDEKNSNLILVSSRDSSGQNWVNADLTDEDFEFSDLESANFQGAILKNANFFHANLEEANLKDADLSGANFRYANLDGANLENIRVDSRTSFKGAILSFGTRRSGHHVSSRKSPNISYLLTRYFQLLRFKIRFKIRK